MNYIFDTDSVSFLYDSSREPQHTKIFNFVSNIKDSDNLYISIVTLYELEYSLSNSPNTKKEKIQFIIDNALILFEVLDLPKSGATLFGKLKCQYKGETLTTKSNLKKNNIDFMIASTAITNSCIVISYDSIFETISKINTNLRTEKF